MRTVTFSDNNVQAALESDFVCTFTNTKGDPAAGASFSHAPDSQPGPCGPRAGRQNVQLVFMSPDAEIFHAACGFLSPEDMQLELSFAADIFHALQKSKSGNAQMVANKHFDQLRQLGYSKQEIDQSVSQFGDSVTSFSPQDLDLQIPVPKLNLTNNEFTQGLASALQDPSRYRKLRDYRFMIDNPLMARKDFEKAPQKLLGDHQSFFGSNAAMQGVSDMTKQQSGLIRQEKVDQKDKEVRVKRR